MLDIGADELLLIIIVAVIVIGPKDLPRALRTAGQWMAKVRKVSGHFRAGLDAMVREAEMAELEKQWQEQNLKIMREHPADAPPEMEPTGAYPARPAPPAESAPPPASAEARAVTVDNPEEYSQMPASDAPKPD
jgi:sec-independent protein translocase protein TatB